MNEFEAFLDELNKLRLKYARVLIGLALAAGLLVLSPWSLCWNATHSIPLGLYAAQRLDAQSELQPGDIVCYYPTTPSWAVGRDYFVPGIRVCKPIVGVAGDEITSTEHEVRIHSQTRGTHLEVPMLDRDSKGRELPAHAGTSLILASDQVFLVSTYAPNSLDSRYLGPVAREALTHRIYPLITY